MKKLIAYIVLFIGGFMSSAMAQDNPKEASMFPEAEKGFKKVVINVPAKKNEDLLKVELTVGKNAEVDKCNKHFIAGSLKEKTLEGWGYNYYDFKSTGQIAGTKMGCPTNEKIIKFVTGETIITRYNSKLPLVIYVPEDMTVKYKFWKAKDKWLTNK